MKKLLPFIGVLLIIFTIFNMKLINNTKVFANNNDIEFNNFEFSYEKTRENGKIKVRLIFSWDTTEEILIDQISTKISNQFQTTENKTSGVKTDNGYHYEIDYIVQNWQIGTLELTIRYYLLDEINFSNIQEKVFYIPGGKWVKDDVSFSKALIVGIGLTILTICSTFILIENSRKGYMDSEKEQRSLNYV